MRWVFPKPDRVALWSKRHFNYEVSAPRETIIYGHVLRRFVEVGDEFGEAGMFDWSRVKEYKVLHSQPAANLGAFDMCNAMLDNINAQAWVDADKKPSWWREITGWKPEWIERRLAGEDVAAELNAKLLEQLQSIFYPVDDIDVDDAIGYNDVVFEREHRRNQLKRSEG